MKLEHHVRDTKTEIPRLTGEGIAVNLYLFIQFYEFPKTTQEHGSVSQLVRWQENIWTATVQ